MHPLREGAHRCHWNRTPKWPTGGKLARNATMNVSMTQLVIAAALGFIIGQCVLLALKHGIRYLRRDESRLLARRLFGSQGSSLTRRVVRYAFAVAASAAILTLGAWAVLNYQAAREAQRAVSNTAARHDAAPPSPPASADVAAAQPEGSARTAPGAAITQAAEVDPYADPSFKAPPTLHRRGSRYLTAILLQRSEARARADLLRETEEHAQRSQYDCEAAERAKRYLQNGMDVWGFTAWQIKYFPTDEYLGATLAQCKSIKNRLDVATAAPHATVVADGNAPAPDS